MLPPLCDSQTEEDRKNLSLKSKNGSVHADIWLLGPSGDAKIDPYKPRRTTISLISSHGAISAQVVRHFVPAVHVADVRASELSTMPRRSHLLGAPPTERLGWDYHDPLRG
jgi:hypothetical protein